MRRQVIVLAAVLVDGAARRPGRRPRRVVGEGFYPQAGRGGRGDRSPPSSRAPANRSSSTNSHKMTIGQGSGGARGRPAAGFPVRHHRPNSWAAVGLRGPARRLSDGTSDRSSSLFDPDVIEASTLLDGDDGPTRPLRLADGLEFQSPPRLAHPAGAAGFTLADIPKEWGAFWSFWCDQVQPAVRKARDATISGASDYPCRSSSATPQRTRTIPARVQGDWLGPEHRLQVDDPAIRARLVKALDAYTAISQGLRAARLHQLGQSGQQQGIPSPNCCDDGEHHPLDPDRAAYARPEDYYKNVATIDWPNGADGQPLALWLLQPAVVFKAGGTLRRTGVRALSRRRRLARPLARLRGRPIPAADAKAREQPFWLDPGDPHRMRGGHPNPDPPALRSDCRSTGQRVAIAPIFEKICLGRRQSTASRPRASRPSRRSTRRSPASSRSSPNSCGAAHGVMRRSRCGHGRPGVDRGRSLASRAAQLCVAQDWRVAARARGCRGHWRR